MVVSAVRFDLKCYVRPSASSDSNAGFLPSNANLDNCCGAKEAD